MNICWFGNGLYKHDTGYLETWLLEHHSLPLFSTPSCAFPKPWADKTLRELGADEDSGLCSYPCKT